jgi:exosortase
LEERVATDHDKNGDWKLTIRLPSLPSLAGFKNPSNLALALKVSTVLVAVITLYFQDLRIIFADAFTNETTSYILIIPFLLAYLIYRKRKMVRAAITSEKTYSPASPRHFGTLGGILLSATAIILYWYGSYTFTPLEYHVLTLPFFAAGLTLVLFNPQTLRQLAFPIAFLAFLVPLPLEIIYSVGSTLSVISSEAPNAIVNTSGIHSTISSISGTPAITITQANGTILPPFTVDIACSGMYSLIAFIVFAAFIAFVVRDKLWKKATIFAVGFPLIYFLNILRITLILLIAYQWGEQLALNIFHLLSGWILIFLGTLALLIISEKLFKTQIFTKKQTLHNCPNCNPHPSNQTDEFCLTCGRLTKYLQTRFRKTDVAKIVAIALVVILLMSIQAPVFALTQGPAEILIQTPTGQQGSNQVFPPMPNYTLQFFQRQTDFEQMSGQDYSLVYSYTPQDHEEETVFIGLEIAQTITPLHRWEVCLVTWPQALGYQPTVEQLDLRDVQVLQNPLIIARYFAFKDKSDNQTEVVLYWYENAIFTANGTSEQKYVEISVIAYPNTQQDIPSMENELMPFATAIVNYWQPIKMWTAIAITLSRNGITLAEITIALLAAVIIFYTSGTIKQRRANAVAYPKLSSQNKQIIESIAETRKTTKPTLGAIADTYKSRTGVQIEEKDLLQKLSETEKTGIIASTTANVQDEPTRVWKTKLAIKKSGAHKRLSMSKQTITSRLKWKRGT